MVSGCHMWGSWGKGQKLGIEHIEQARMVLRRRIIDWVLQVYALSEIGEEHNKKQRFLELLSGGLRVCAAMSEHRTCRERVLPGSIRCAKHATCRP